MKSFETEQSIDTTTYKQQAYEIVKEAILYRKLTPGEIYSQESICSVLGISRTPVREALLELSKEGYLSFLRGRGVLILPMDKKEAKDVVELRHILEIEGSKLAAERADEEQKEIIRKNVQLMQEQICAGESSKILYKTDREFHRGVSKATGNLRLMDTIEQCRDHYLRVQSQTAFNSREQSDRVLEEHRRIMEAICENDAEKAAIAMEEHLNGTADRTLYEIM